MQNMVSVVLLGFAATVAEVGSASAGCAFGSQYLGGSIPGYSYDGTRFFTSDGGRITVRINAVNAPLRVSFPGYCGPRQGYNISCTTWAPNGARVYARIENANPNQVTYDFICDG